MNVFKLLVTSICFLVFRYISEHAVKSAVILEKIAEKELVTVAKGTYQAKPHILKILKQEFIKTNSFSAYSELEISHLLAHPNIIALQSSYSEKNGDMVLVYEEGEATLEKCTFPNLYEVKKAIRDTLVGLLYMHRRGIMHNDVKTDNVVKVGKYYKLIDFGSARFFNPEYNYNFYYRKDGYYPHVAPEIKNKGKHNLKSDLVGVGFIFKRIFSISSIAPNGFSPEEKTKTELFLKKLSAQSIPERFTLEEALYDPWLAETRIKLYDLTKFADCKSAEKKFSKEGNILNITIDEKTKLKIQTHKAPGKDGEFFNTLYLNGEYALETSLPTYYIEVINSTISSLKKI